MKTEKDLVQSGEPDEDPKPESQEAAPDTTGAGALISASSMLPGISVSQNALIVATQRRELYNHITYGYTSAMERIRSYPGTRPFSPPKAEAAALIKGRDENALIVMKEDPLETVRKQLGLDQLREELIEELRKFLSVSRGLEMLEHSMSERFKRPVKGMDAVFALFPSLTVAEIALFPLLRTIPLIYWQCSPAYAAEAKDPYGILKGRIPQPHYASPRGMSFVRDDFSSESEEAGIAEIDVYQTLGLTGIRRAQDFSEFRSRVRSIISKLIPLTITNNRLFERVWRESSEAAQIALGRIERYCLEGLLGGEALDINAIPIEVARATLSPENRKELEGRCRKIEANIAASTVYDLARNEVLDAERMFRLIGLLASLPPAFLGDEPFTGYSMPFGASIRFLAQDGTVVDQVPLHPTYARNALEGIHFEGEDDSRYNRTTNSLFALMRREVTEETLTRIMEEDDFGSPSERDAARLWLERGVAIDVSGGFEVEDSDRSRSYWIFEPLSASHHKVRFVKKMGPEETALTAATLMCLPQSMFSRIHRLRKVGHHRSITERMSGVVTLGEYDPKERRIELKENLFALFPETSDAQKIGLQFTILHECGEALWTLLSEEQKAEWKAITWPRNRKKRPSKRQFLTWYSTVDEKEDFCEHFAAYIVHGGEFRIRAAHAPALKKKYDFIAALFREYAGRDMEYNGIEARIEEIHGALRKRRKELTLKDAILEAEEDAEHASMSEQEGWEIREDIDEIEDRWESEARREEDEDYESHSSSDSDDWAAIARFEGDTKRAEEQLSFREHELRGSYKLFRKAVIETVTSMPRSRGRILRIAAAVCPGILAGDSRAVARELRFLPKAVRKEFVRVLMSHQGLIMK